MAGPMYHGTSTFGGIEAKMAEDRMKVLKTAEAEMDLEDYKKSKELMKKNALKEDAIKKLTAAKTNEPTLIPTMDRQQDPMLSYQTQDKGTRQGPTGLEQAPTEYATAETTDVNPTSPFGTYEQRGADSPADMPYGFGGAIPKDYKSPEQVLQTQVDAGSDQEQPPTEAQPQEQVPVQGYNQPPPPQETPPPPVSNIATVAKKATLDFTEANDQVESAYNLAEAFKREGLLKPYQKQLEVAGKLEEARTMAQSRRITATKDVMEMTGRIAGSYVEVAKRTNDPVELERAWQSSMMLLEMNGIPAGQLRAMTDPRARLAIAEKYSDASMSAAKKLELMLKQNKIVSQNNIAQNQLDLKNKLVNETLNMGAFRREIGTRNIEQKELTAYIKEGKDKVTSLQTTLKGKQDTLKQLLSSNTYFDKETGLVLDDETRAKEIILARQEVENLDTQIKLEREKIDTYSAKLKPGARDTTGKTTTENTTAPPQEVIQDTIKALNANPSKALLDHVKAKFKEAYPDLEFEKYIKVNPAKYK
jgi:hypothetical protein